MCACLLALALTWRSSVLKYAHDVAAVTHSPTVCGEHVIPTIPLNSHLKILFHIMSDRFSSIGYLLRELCSVVGMFVYLSIFRT